MSGPRWDGRESNQMRPPQVEFRPLLRSDGSARFCFGHSVVVAAVYGPREAKSKAKEIPDRATFEVIVRPRVGIPGQAERTLEGHLLRQLDHIVIHTEYPRTQITVVVQVCSSDGSVRAAAGNAAFLALLDAGVALRATVLSVCIGVRGVSDDSQMVDETDQELAVPSVPILLLDPTDMEEKECDAVVTFGVDSRRDILVSSLSTGVAVDAPVWASCVEAGNKACQVLEAFLRMSLSKRLDTFIR